MKKHLLCIFIIRNISINYVKIEEGYDLYSDHEPIRLSMSNQIISKDQKTTPTKNQMENNIQSPEDDSN